MASSDQMRGVIGIANLGNTCYMNSAIQALRHCPELTVFCKKSGKMIESIQDKESAHAKVSLAYQDLIQSVWAGTGPAYVRPMGFYAELKKIVEGTIYDDFIRKTPQDAHEFLVWLLDQLYMATQKQIEMTIQKPERLSPMYLSAAKGWISAFEKQYSPLTDMIFGLMRIQYKCHSCSALHTRWETFNILKIPLVNPANLMDCVREELKSEEIDGYNCDACKQKVKTTKSLSIWRLPKVLVVTLKRFTPMGTRDNQSLQYDGNPVNFAEQFSVESNEESKKKTYKLFATVDHHGNHMGGHYTAQAYSPVWKNWHRYDDETATSISEPHFGPETYILFFRQTA